MAAGNAAAGLHAGLLEARVLVRSSMSILFHCLRWDARDRILKETRRDGWSSSADLESAEYAQSAADVLTEG